MHLQHPRRDALLLTTAGIAVLLLAPILFLQNGQYGASLKGQLSGAQSSMAVVTLEHGQILPIPTDTPVIIRCPSANADRVFLDPRMQLSPRGGEAEEFTDADLQMSSGRLATHNAGNLTQFLPDHFYRIKVAGPTSIQCSAIMR